MPEESAPGPRVAPPRLRLSGIGKRFPGVVAAHDVDIDVQPGEIVGVLGENGAGKTTVMNIVFGLLRPDDGTMEVDGEPFHPRGPRDALRHGIGMVHQHFKLVGRMSVAENVALGLRPARLTALRLGQTRRRIEALSHEFDLGVSPDDRIDDLSVGQQQRVEILKLLVRDVRLLILDEPTATLTGPEWERLAAILRGLAASGHSVVLITHKLNELFDLADRVVVLRGGHVVGRVLIGDASREMLARMMVGRPVVLETRRRSATVGAPALVLRDIVLRDGDRTLLHEVNLEVRAGEIVGLAGVDGNGQRELVEIISGQRAPTAGAVEFLDQSGEVAGPYLAVIPEDRHRLAVALDLSLTDNLLLRELRHRELFQRGIVRSSRVHKHCENLVRTFDVRTPDLRVRMGQLSGGNQQKAVLARELYRNPRVIIASMPTRGLDVGAMEFVHERLQDHKQSGAAILLISTELSEVLSLSDRISAISRGRLSPALPTDELDEPQHDLLMSASAL